MHLLLVMSQPMCASQPHDIGFGNPLLWPKTFSSSKEDVAFGLWDSDIPAVWLRGLDQRLQSFFGPATLVWVGFLLLSFCSDIVIKDS